MFDGLCLTSHRQRGHLETAPPFTVPCEGHEACFLHRPHRESNPGSLRGSPLHNRCAIPAPRLEQQSLILCVNLKSQLTRTYYDYAKTYHKILIHKYSILFYNCSFQILSKKMFCLKKVKFLQKRAPQSRVRTLITFPSPD